MSARLNLQWIARVNDLILSSNPIDEVTGFMPAKQWLITQLTKAKRPFKLYQLGSGVVRITTNTDACPCCNRKL